MTSGVPNCLIFVNNLDACMASISDLWALIFRNNLDARMASICNCGMLAGGVIG